MDQRVRTITLGVKNLDTSRKFYVDGFGWKPVFENKEIILFSNRGMVFALFLRDHLAEDFAADPRSFGRAPIALAYNVRTKAEVDPLMQRAASAGAKILKPARGVGLPCISRIPTGSRGKYRGILNKWFAKCGGGTYSRKRWRISEASK